MCENTCDISIVVPIFNVEAWLSRCLNSIHQQTYRNFEVLLIDDGSTDNSSSICKNFLKKDSRFKYFRKKNGGLSDARNYGLDCAKGKYIIFIDSDDYIEPEYVKTLYSNIQDTNADVAICGFNRVNENGKLIDSNNLYITNKELLNGEEVIESSFDNKNNGWALQYANELLADNKDIVMEAVMEDYSALKWASTRLKRDKELAIMAIKKCDKAIKYVDRDLQIDDEIINIYLRSCYEENFDFQYGVTNTLKNEYERLLKEQRLIIKKQKKIRCLLMYIEPSYVRNIDEREKIKLKK